MARTGIPRDWGLPLLAILVSLSVFVSPVAPAKTLVAMAIRNVTEKPFLEYVQLLQYSVADGQFSAMGKGEIPVAPTEDFCNGAYDRQGKYLFLPGGNNNIFRISTADGTGDNVTVQNPPAGFNPGYIIASATDPDNDLSIYALSALPSAHATQVRRTRSGAKHRSWMRDRATVDDGLMPLALFQIQDGGAGLTVKLVAQISGATTGLTGVNLCELTVGGGRFFFADDTVIVVGDVTNATVLATNRFVYGLGTLMYQPGTSPTDAGSILSTVTNFDLYNSSHLVQIDATSLKDTLLTTMPSGYHTFYQSTGVLDAASRTVYVPMLAQQLSQLTMFSIELDTIRITNQSIGEQMADLFPVGLYELNVVS